MPDQKAIDINISGTLPFEGLMNKFLDVWIRTRETQDRDIRRGFDLIALKWMMRVDHAIDAVVPLPADVVLPKQIEPPQEAPNGTH